MLPRKISRLSLKKSKKLSALLSACVLLSLSGCSGIKTRRGLNPNQNIEKNRSSLFEYSDKAGRFYLQRESGRMAKSAKYMVKEKMYVPDEENEEVERLVSISKVGEVNGLKLLRPERSQYTVWFDGKKYSSELKLDVQQRKMLVEMSSPEKEWNGSEEFSFPKGTGVYCFFSQVIECASITGFINKALEKKAGVMRFHIVWDGYPYIMEQYPGIPEGVFSSASLEYDGQTESGEKRFMLKFGGETIFYMVNPISGQFTKKMWVSQGVTQTLRGQP